MRSESLSSWLVRGALWAMGDGFWMPLRMIGAIALGEEALEASYSLAGAAIVGALVHMALSALYGAVFGALLALVPALRGSVGLLVIVGSFYGLAIWLFNFYVVAPVAFEWFQDADAVVQFVAHVLFFGALLGGSFARVAPHAEPARRREPLRA
jgi:hypothetical protein